MGNNIEDDLSRQIQEMMSEDEAMNTEGQDEIAMTNERQTRGKDSLAARNNRKKRRRKKKIKRAFKIIGIILVVLLLIVGFFIGTKPGRKMIYKMGGDFVSDYTEDAFLDYDFGKESKNTRNEKYIRNYLILGIEEIKGARNTDTIMIGTINTKDNSIKLTSLLRDSYVEIPGYKKNKINSAYAKGGIPLLTETIELNYKIKIDGYASVNFDRFETIVDLLGGVDIELGEKEAAYLNRTNYISNKKYRNVTAGMNHLNGNQLMGYVRVRKVPTLGGAHSDYGRVVRQQRALQAMFDAALSGKNIMKILPLSKEVLSYVTTSLSNEQISEMMEAVIENKITTIEKMRIPVDGTFESPIKYEGIGYPIVIQWDVNRIELYKFIYGETEEQAKEALAQFK